MKSTIRNAILIGLTILLFTLIECRYMDSMEKPHWSYNNFPGVSFKNRVTFSAPRYHHSIPYDSVFDRANFRSHFPTHRSLASYDQQFAAPSRRMDQFVPPPSPSRQQYLLGLAASLYRHKQAQNDYSNQLLSSFGSNVAPFDKK